MHQDKKAAPLGGYLDAPSIIASARDPQWRQREDTERRAMIARGETVFEMLPSGQEVQVTPDADGKISLESVSPLYIEDWPMFADALSVMHERYSPRTWEEDLDRTHLDLAVFSLGAERLHDTMQSAGAETIGELAAHQALLAKDREDGNK